MEKKKKESYEKKTKSVCRHPGWAYLIIKGDKNILLRVRDDMGVIGSSFTFGAGTIKKGTCPVDVRREDGKTNSAPQYEP